MDFWGIGLALVAAIAVAFAGRHIYQRGRHDARMQELEEFLDRLDGLPHAPGCGCYPCVQIRAVLEACARGPAWTPETCPDCSPASGLDHAAGCPRLVKHDDDS